MSDTVHESLDMLSLGMVETRGLVAALEAADAMLKASSVTLVGMEQTVAALITVQVRGETAAVQSAVDAGTAAASKIGEVLSSHVIARPSSDLVAMQEGALQERPVASKASALEDMTVRELRAFAREQENLPIKGREIARANKQQLLAALRKK